MKPFKVILILGLFLFNATGANAQLTDSQIGDKAKSYIGKTDVNSKKLNTQMSWHAVRYCAKMAGLIDQKKLSTITLVKIINPKDQAVANVSNVPKGHLIGFYSGTRLLHLMISSGNGKAVGSKSMLGLGMGQAAKWEELDLKKLNIKDGKCIHLKTNKPLIVVHKPITEITNFTYYKNPKTAAVNEELESYDPPPSAIVSDDTDPLKNNKTKDTAMTMEEMMAYDGAPEVGSKSDDKQQNQAPFEYDNTTVVSLKTAGKRPDVSTRQTGVKSKLEERNKAILQILSDIPKGGIMYNVKRSGSLHAYDFKTKTYLRINPNNTIAEFAKVDINHPRFFFKHMAFDSICSKSGKDKTMLDEKFNINPELKLTGASQTTYNTSAKKPQYVGEDKGASTAFSTSVIQYCSVEERRYLEIFVKNGKLVDYKGELISTVGGFSGGVSNETDKGIFVMDGNGRIYYTRTSTAQVFHHSSFLGGAEVAASGELIIKEGMLVQVSNSSGHYKQKIDFTNQLIDELKERGYTPKIKVKDVHMNTEKYHNAPAKDTLMSYGP